MSYSIKPVDVWAVDVVNRPGRLARVLEGLAQAGAMLEFMIARRASATTSRVFVAPLTTARERKMAADLGLTRAAGVHAVRIEGPDRPGLGAAMTRTLSDHDLNLRGASAAAIGRKALFYFSFDSVNDQKAAIGLLRRGLRAKQR